MKTKIRAESVAEIGVVQPRKELGRELNVDPDTKAETSDEYPREGTSREDRKKEEVTHSLERNERKEGK